MGVRRCPLALGQTKTTSYGWTIDDCLLELAFPRTRGRDLNGVVREDSLQQQRDMEQLALVEATKSRMATKLCRADVTYPGSPWMQMTVEYNIGGAAYDTVEIGSGGSFGWSTISTTDLSEGTLNHQPHHDHGVASGHEG